MRPDGRVWLACGVLVFGAGLAASAVMRPASALMLDEPKDTRRAVLKRVPVGSAPDAARATMTAEGFSCAQIAGQSFAVREPDSTAVETHSPTDFLWCDSGDLGIGFKKRWQVFFVDRGGPVSGVAVGILMSAPFTRSGPMPPS